jgi:putative endonuclease
VGYTRNYKKRLIEHNSSLVNSFTAKHRPWLLKTVFKCGSSEKVAIRLERFIKRQKSRKLL